MLINKDSIVIDGISMAQYITEAKFGWHKLWGKDSGRNLAGSNKGTLVGVFPKITLSFRKLTQEEVELLTPVLDSVNQVTKYYDPNLKGENTMSTYAGDWEYVCKRFEKCEAFTCAFISNHKRR